MKLAAGWAMIPAMHPTRPFHTGLCALLLGVCPMLAADPLPAPQAAGVHCNDGSAGMGALHALAPSRVRLHALTTPEAGCNPKAPWCLHQTLVTRRPHDPQRFDLARDHGQIGPDRPVHFGYLLPR